MPTYRYRCEGCGDEFEVWQSITDDALTTHDDTGCGGSVVKVLSPAGIVLKGSGFYKTDNRGGRSSSSRNGDGAKDSGSSSSDSSSSTSSSSGDSSSSGSGSDSSGGGATKKSDGASSGSGSSSKTSTSSS